MTKQYLQSLLDIEMHGIRRMPALLLNNPFSSLETSNLKKYEILVNEPLHDISNHIKNIQQELPHHVGKDKKRMVNDVIISTFNGKEAKNSADHRSLLLLTNWFVSHMKNHFSTNLLETLCKIQEILYLPEEKRNAQKILQLILALFSHAMIIKIHMDGHIKSMSERKFYGIYYHSLIRHSAEQYRLFSGRSSNTEKEEAVFNTLKKFANLTSNHHPDNMIYNALVRIQAHQILTANEEDKERNDETFAKLYQPIKQNLSNTIISFEWIEKHYSCYQALLEQIADYLIYDTKFWKETAMGILFLDNEANKNLNIKIHNFRSSTIEDVNNYLRRCWNKCLENPNTLIPAFKIKMLNGEKWKTERWTTLEYFRNKFLEEDQTDHNASINNSDTTRSNNVKICILQKTITV